ncbi:UNVERIFIED_CONTAM: hypothetical protein NCL1_51173 [Trichonephila clavipes]
MTYDFPIQYTEAINFIEEIMPRVPFHSTGFMNFHSNTMKQIISLTKLCPEYLFRFEGEYLGGGQRPPAFLTFLPTLRENLGFEGYLECPMPYRYYTFTNIHAFSCIRTQARWHCNKHH